MEDASPTACRFCGAPVPAGARYCESCGQALDAPVAEGQPPDPFAADAGSTVPPPPAEPPAVEPPAFTQPPQETPPPPPPVYNPPLPPAPPPAKPTNWVLIVVIVLVVLCLCCVIGAVVIGILQRIGNSTSGLLPLAQAWLSLVL